MKTFKQMIRDGEIKRADAMKVHIDDIHEEPGFNLRREGEDLDASIDALAEFIFAGGIIPPLEVRPRDDGGVFVVDGHRRRRAILKAIERGAPIEWVAVVAFSGNDVDRVARIMTSAEGRALAPLEVAAGYKRLTAFGLSPEDIAGRVHKTRQHVDQLLILANANADVQQMVADGIVSATLAIDVVRKHGDKAGEYLRDKTAGKRKITAGTIKPKALPRVVVDDVAERIERFTSELPQDVKLLICGNPQAVRQDKTVAVPALLLREIIDAHAAIVDARAEQDRRQRAKEAKNAQGELQA